jgi:hypothetical protein
VGVRDEAGFEAFVAVRSDDLLRTAVLLTRDRGHAEDLLQTALVKAYRRWNRISGEAGRVRCGARHSRAHERRGVGPLDAQAAANEGGATTVRILDDAGTVVAETPIIETME